jgi:hypothetical protein
MSDVQNDPRNGLSNLSRPEHLLVWAMRAIALGREDCPIVVEMFQRSCGARGEEVLQAYSIFVKYVAMTSRRRLQVHAPGCPCVGPDERALMAVLAAAQRSLEDLDEEPLHSRLWALIGRRDESLLQVAQRIGQLLRLSGLVLATASAALAPEGGATGEPPPLLLH